MALKIVVFYNQFSQGWTETYYTNSTSSPNDWLTSNYGSTWSPFVSFRHPSVSLYGVRASVIGTPRSAQTYIFTGSAAQTGSTSLSNSDTPDVTTSDAFIDLYDNNSHRRPLYIRGLNDSDITRTPFGVSNPSSKLSQGINAMLAAMIKKNLCIAVQNQPPAGNLAWFAVGQVAVPTGNANAAALAVDGVIAPIQNGVTQVRFKGIPRDDLPGFPRIATITANTPGAGVTAITIPYRIRASGPTPYIPTKLMVTLLTYTYSPISTLTFVKFGERKTGRPIGVSRGRTRPAVRAL